MEKNRALDRIKSQNVGYDATELFSKRKMAQEEEEDFLSDDEYDEYKKDLDEEGFNTFGSAGADNMSSTNLNEATVNAKAAKAAEDARVRAQKKKDDLLAKLDLGSLSGD